MNATENSFLTPQGNYFWALPHIKADAPRVAPETGARKALFLDRDGVVNRDTHYVADPAKVELIDGIDQLIVHARQANYLIVVVTNQAGISRGLFGWSDFGAVQNEIVARLRNAGVAEPFDAVAACPFHPQFAKSSTATGSADWRKPEPGMLLHAAHNLNIDLSLSWIAGDRVSDLQAGLRAGMGTIAHVATGAMAPADVKAELGDVKNPTRVCYFASPGDITLI